MEFQPIRNKGSRHGLPSLSGWTKLLQWTACIFLAASSVLAETPPSEPELNYLKSLSLEELLEVQVTSVSKRSELLFEAPAAVFVITAEDIRRTGARTIPEALRLAPGLEVARIDSAKWAVTARGFNERFTNKLLVLVDGRSAYNPLFSGVYWDIQDTVLADIDRIEVIRGPGATLWGANAVNGIINIITKSSAETLGGLATAGVDNDGGYEAAARYGGLLTEDLSYRFFAKGFDRTDLVDAGGRDFGDDWDALRAGFRLDRHGTAEDVLTLLGEVYRSDAGQQVGAFIEEELPLVRTLDDTVEASGGFALTRWRHTLSPGADATFQIYYDRTERDEAVFSENRDTFDVDFQNRWQMTDRQELIWGLGYRLTRDEVDGSFTSTLDPENRTDHLFSAFVQDTIELWPDTFHLTLGSKFEHNDYSGFEVQPNLRAGWHPAADHFLWGAISRAVRTPSRSDHDLRVSFAGFRGPQGVPTVLAVVGDEDFDSEDLTAYELGYRWHPTGRFFMDFAAFYNRYDRLRSLEPDTPFMEASPPPPHLVIPLRIDNRLDGVTYGFEWLVDVIPTEKWKLTASYSFLEIDLEPDDDSRDETAEEAEGFSPRHQIGLVSFLDLPHAVSFDSEIYYVDELPEFGIPDYWRLDLRLGWRPAESLHLSLNGENLLDDRHPEFGERSGVFPAEVPRRVYATATWTW